MRPLGTGATTPALTPASCAAVTAVFFDGLTEVDMFIVIGLGGFFCRRNCTPQYCPGAWAEIIWEGEGELPESARSCEMDYA